MTGDGAPRKWILLVEDNPDDVELTRRALELNQIRNEVIVAPDAEAALDLLFGTARTSTPEVILLDLKLRKLDGFEVLRRVRAAPETRSVPVVVLTSSNEGVDLARAYELGANSYVRKPIDFAQFVEAARQIGAYWLVLNLTPGAPAPGAPDAEG